MSNLLFQPLPRASRTARRGAAALTAVGLGLTVIGPAAAAGTFDPSSAFVQFGSTQGTRAATLGLTRDLPYRWQLGQSELSSYLEASYSWWHIDSADRAGRSQLSQIAVIPTLRLRPSEGASPWFFEAGLGVTATSSLYRTRQKGFSTSFNFGTHLAVGRSFGERRQHEVALRVEHFSNAGIKQPNPGENFVQLRYARRF